MVTRSDTSSFSFTFERGLRFRLGVLRRTAVEAKEVVFAYHFNDLEIVRSTGTAIPSNAADLIDIMAMVALADRVAPRPDSLILSERRRISLSLPVRQPDYWREAERLRMLDRILTHLTHDHWDISFTHRTDEPRPSELQSSLGIQGENKNPSVILHSGGLDALLGMIDQLTSYPTPLIAVSAATHPRNRNVQRDVIKHVQSVFGPRVMWCPVTMRFIGLSRHFQERESSQRARGLFFLVIGAITAHLSGSQRLVIAENGFGAINLPYTDEHRAHHRSLIAHPMTLSMAQGLMRDVLHPEFTIVNSAFWMTKGEMSQSLQTSQIEAAIRSTVSCDRFPWIASDRPCGACTSCILRRIALMRAGVNEHVGYGFDVLNANSDWSGSDTRPLYAFRIQAEVLRSALASTNPMRQLQESFPEIVDIFAAAPYLRMSTQEIAKRVERLLCAHVEEWDRFTSRFTRLDWRAQPPHPNANLSDALASTIPS